MNETGAPPPETPPEIIDHYLRFEEADRLQESGFGVLERLRTEQILDRFLPPPPAVIVDIGSGPGVYSVWLAQRGYEVHAIDPVPRHIEQATTRADHHGTALASAEVGDARRLALASRSADAVLLLGPLYHLQARADRLLALTEAHRLLQPGGVLAAAAINRFASLLDGLDRGFIDDPAFRERVNIALETGGHSNPTDDPTYFTTAYFHRAAELADELRDSRFANVAVHAVEGVAWLADDLTTRLADPQRRADLLGLADRLANEPSLIGVSPHLLATAIAN